MKEPFVSIRDRLFLPSSTQAVLWDLDGTLVDSFALDLRVCSKIISKYAGKELIISEVLLREGFPLSGKDFWRFLFEGMGLAPEPDLVAKALEDWLALRLIEPFPLHEGIAEILSALKARGLRMAVVSNNPEAEVIKITGNSGMSPWFDIVVGNDGQRRAEKPAPDSYIFAAERLEIPIANCAVIEDSVLGLQAGRASRAFTIGVASGAEAFNHLAASAYADVCYTSFRACSCSMDGSGATVRLPDSGVALLLQSALGHCGRVVRIDWNNNDWALLARRLNECMQTGSPRPRVAQP